MRVWVGAVLAAGAMSLAACASDPGPGRDRNEAPQVHALLSADTLVFATFDADGDMKISTAELEAGITREFTRADTNHDGALQPIEFQNWSNAALGGGNLPPYRLDFDRNVDNTITAEEFHAEFVARAHMYDADEDGVLTRAEMIRTVTLPHAERRREPEGMRHMERGRPPGR